MAQYFLSTVAQFFIDVRKKSLTVRTIIINGLSLLLTRIKDKSVNAGINLT